MFDPNEADSYPHLLQHLWDRYKEHIVERILRAKTAAGRALSAEEAAKRAPATDFVSFAAGYLNDNRGVSSFFIDDNIGLRLSDNTTVKLCPGDVIRGTMQESSSVDITSAPTAKGREGVTASTHVNL